MIQRRPLPWPSRSSCSQGSNRPCRQNRVGRGGGWFQAESRMPGWNLIGLCVWSATLEEPGRSPDRSGDYAITGNLRRPALFEIRTRACVFVCAVVFILFSAVPAKAVTPAEISASIDKGKKYLYATEKNGNWEIVPGTGSQSRRRISAGERPVRRADRGGHLRAARIGRTVHRSADSSGAGVSPKE